MVTLPMYEYLPYLFGLLGLGYILYKRGASVAIAFAGVVLLMLAALSYLWFTPGVLASLAETVLKGKDALQVGNFTVLLLGALVLLSFFLSYDPENTRTRFPTLIAVWTLGVLLMFSWAGEKMPWLTMHLAIPLSFVGGYFLDRVLDADWRTIARRGG